ncbi:MAG: S8 family serine peptidase, partial [Actinobacteria bacterium]|nr:S8 family serine peptidase [Actinomycetota bacterium]
GGGGTWAGVICGIDYVTANAGSIDVANMSLTGSGSATGCADGGMHEAICKAVAAGVPFVVAAGNDSRDASGFVPAAYPEAITVSAFSDTNGNSTNAGCSGVGPWKACDEVFAGFSNYGSIVDVTAPGVKIYSTIIDGYGSKDGTSMAAPHVAGLVGLVIAANPGATPAEVDAHLKATGECPDTADNDGDATCAGQGTWSGDPDGIPEPLINAASAALTTVGAGTTEPAPTDTLSPTVAITNPADGATVSGTIEVTATADDAGDGNGVSKVEFQLDGALQSTDTSSPYSWTWDSATSTNGAYTITATAYDPSGNTATTSITVTVDNAASSITLSATGYKIKGAQHADLSWSGATSTSVDIYRNGAKLTTTANDGAYTDNIGQKGGGSYTYELCEAGTATCSNKATVTF